MKTLIRILSLCLLAFFLSSCAVSPPTAQIVATTGPVFQFTTALCDGTPLSVSQLVTEQVSCLHDYSLQVQQMRDVETAQVVIISGAGLEDFMSDVLVSADTVIDCSVGISLLCGEGSHAEEGHNHEHSHGHSHEEDPHIWLSPANAQQMVNHLCDGLCAIYPEYSAIFQENLVALTARLGALQSYGDAALSDLQTRELITFHDGFSYFAESFNLTILESIEEESGSEASAKDLKALIGLVQSHDLPAIFTERNGSVSAADVISRETGVSVFALDMAMAGSDYFEAMRHNIDTVKEALG